MFIKRLVVLLLAVFTTCCAVAPYPVDNPLKEGPTTVVMHGDKDFTQHEREQFATASTQWFKQTDGLADITFVWDWEPTKEHEDDQNVIVMADSEAPEVQNVDCDSRGIERGTQYCEPMVLAWVYPSGGVHNPYHMKVTAVFIPERYSSDGVFVSVAIHEFGHVLGLPHSPAPQAVMYPTQNAEKLCLTVSDLADFCRYNWCDSRKMYPCDC